MTSPRPWTKVIPRFSCTLEKHDQTDGPRLRSHEPRGLGPVQGLAATSLYLSLSTYISIESAQQPLEIFLSKIKGEHVFQTQFIAKEEN
jgi:hypothetical protein